MNESHQEFEKLKPENTVYKLIGPGLIPQEQDDAKLNVSKRLEFINAEMYVQFYHWDWTSLMRPGLRTRNEKKIKDLQEKSEAKKSEVS